MGRGKVEMKRIENATNRHTTFSKRRSGLFKKAHELSVLCGVEVALIVFSPSGKLYQFASDDCMHQIITKYRGVLGIPQANCYLNLNRRTDEFWKSEINEMRRSVNTLEIKNRQLPREELSSLRMKELRQLERQVKLGIDRIQAKKRQILSEYITMLKRKRKALQEENANLQKKLQELQSAEDVASKKDQFKA